MRLTGYRPRGSVGRFLLGSVLLASACSPNVGVDPTTSVDAVATSTVGTTSATSSSTTTEASLSLPPLARPGDPDARVLFSLPAGDGGVTYEGGFEDWEVDGPQALAVAADGSIWLADTGGRRLLRYSEAGALLLEIDTDGHEVAGLVDLAAVGDSVWGLEIVPAFDRNRIILFDGTGALVTDHELPEGLHLQDGLSGIAATPDGRLWIELEGGSRVYKAFDDEGTFDPRPADGYEASGVTVRPLPQAAGERVARFDVGGTIVERPVRELGAITFEGATEEWITLLLSEVAFSEDGSLSVRTTVLVTDLTGDVVATSEYPLGETATEAYVPNEFIAIGSESRPFALMPSADRLDVVELALFPGPEG